MVEIGSLVWAVDLLVESVFTNKIMSNVTGKHVRAVKYVTTVALRHLMGNPHQRDR